MAYEPGFMTVEELILVLGKKVQLTKDMIESMASENESMTAADILKELQKDRSR